ncbi:MAG: hypothetical protein ACK551_05275 [Vampirovibrionales bacterium]
MKLVASSVAPPTRASFQTRPSPPPQHARTGKLYRSLLPLNQLHNERFYLDLKSLCFEQSSPVFLRFLNEFLTKNKVSEQQLQEIIQSLGPVLPFIQLLTKQHLILSPNSLTLDLGDRTIRIKLSGKAIRNVLNWPAEISDQIQ